MKKKILIIIGIIIILIGLIIGAIGLKKYLAEENAGKQYEELKEEVKTEEEPPIQEEIVEEEKEPLVIPIDFETLTSQYPDVYAWIQIPGTTIDYPIVQKEGDNSYYLYHTIDGVRKTEGSIYTEDYNSKDFTDPNTVIYGHNMKNGTMFKQLHKFRDRQFFNENREIIIYQPDRILYYKIFAAYVYDNRHILLNFDFSDINVYRAYLNSVFEKKGMYGNIDGDVLVTAEDKIITLSTCTGDDSKRYLVQAVLLSIKE